MAQTNIKLRDVLQLIAGSVIQLPDEWKNADDRCFEDIRTNTSETVRICFMCEQETWIETYPEHPILIPWYGCRVTAISADDEDSFQIWLDYIPFMKHKLLGLEDENSDEERGRTEDMR